MISLEAENRFVQDLITKGYRKITSPPGLVGRRFALTYRSVKPFYWMRHRSLEAYLGPKGVFSGGGGDWGSVSRVDAIDLFENIYVDSETVYLPVGNRNYSVAEFPDGIIANGNKAKRVTEFSKEWSLEPNVFFNPFILVDHILWFDGIQVVDRKYLVQSIEQEVKDPKLINRVKNLYPGEAEPWRRHGLGKFLAALGIEVLKHTGVTEIDYMGSLSRASRHIMNELGYKGGLRQKIDEYDKVKIQEFMRPFVLKSHD